MNWLSALYVEAFPYHDDRNGRVLPPLTLYGSPLNAYPTRYLGVFWPDEFRSGFNIIICSQHNMSYPTDDEEGCLVCRGLIDP